MKKIRIGNDIRLKLNISGISRLDQSNIKQVRCYIIDTTFGKDEEEAKKKHARRFTREVFPEFYIPSPYNMHGCGAPAYHVNPANVCCYDRFLPDFHDHHWWPGYRGFGLHPDKFERYHRLWHGMMPIEHFEHPFVTGPDRLPEPWYLADSEVLPTTNTITCMFPAKDQHRCGIYKLVVVLTLFEQGWGKHNLRTYTIDKGDVFELVDDYTGESGNITISVDDSGDRENLLDSIFTESAEYTLLENDIMHIGEYDLNRTSYNLYVIMKDGTKAVFNPYQWNLNELVFSSSDESIVTVDQYGTIYTHELSEGEVKDAMIRVSNADDNEIYFEFKVTVKDSSDALKIGFSFAETVDDLDLSQFDAYYYTSNDYTVSNNEDGKYLWIASEKEINNVESSGFYVPMDEPVVRNGYYIYKSAAAILQGDMKIVIKQKHYEQ